MQEATSRDHRAPAWWFLDTYVVEHHGGGADRATVLEMTLPVGAAPPEHTHRRYDDCFFVLDGELVVRMADEVRTVRPGDWVVTPRGTPHAFRVVGSRPARILAVLDDSSFLDLIRTLGEPAQTPTLPPPWRSPQTDDVLRAFAAHDVNVIGVSITDEEAEALR